MGEINCCSQSARYKFFTVGNILAFLQLADYLQDELTKKDCLKFIKKKMSTKLIMKIYDNIEIQHLTRDLVEDYLNGKSNAEASKKFTEVSTRVYTGRKSSTPIKMNKMDLFDWDVSDFGY